MTETIDPVFDVRHYLDCQREVVDRELDCCLPAEDSPPRQLHAAMRYSVFAGGKRLRPVLALATAETLRRPCAGGRRLAAALELIHTYSLIHDDLPAMDDDDLRRGQPSCHRRFGEGIAILAGNALLTLAFELLNELPGVEPPLRLSVQQRLLSAIGTRGGIVSGQAIDLTSAGGTLSAVQLEEMHRAKTGALITAAVGCTALLCDATKAELEALESFASDVGLAFQIVDDILDVEGSSQVLGKSTGKDQKSNKSTYPSVHGLAESRRLAEALVERAGKELEFLGERAEILLELARFISVRRF